MTCRNCKIKPVWKFTNQTQLCKNCFIDYIEKKVFKTIRKYNMLPKDREIKLSGEGLNHNALKQILENKFKVIPGKDFSSENQSEIAEQTFSNILKGNFTQISATNPNKPLFYISDNELELYSKLNNIKAKPRERNERIQNLFEKFKAKNPDLEINILKASEKLN